MLAYTKGSILLKVDHVSLIIGGRQILRDVCADIEDIQRPDMVQGQVICFLGPSGVGKSTLSRIIAGLQQPTSGQVLVNIAPASTSVWTKKPVCKGMVGMVPQNYPLFEFATVLDNLLIAGRQARLSPPAAKTKAIELMQAFGLIQYGDLYPCQLSGGTRQRVAIVRQLMCAGHYLVMDEPFSGLDPIMKRKASEMITRVADLDEQNTIILVTHDVSEGMLVADTVWLMGYEQDAKGNWLPGGRLVEQIDLAAEGLCWHADLATDTAFLQRVADVKQRFSSLMPS